MSGSWDAMIAAELAGELPATIRCCECGREHAGTRAEARAERWEPFSTRTQLLLDHGPMICPDCILASLDALDTALRAAAQAGRF